MIPTKMLAESNVSYNPLFVKATQLFAINVLLAELANSEQGE
jgi:hypothetical protein